MNDYRLKNLTQIIEDLQPIISSYVLEVSSNNEIVLFFTDECFGKSQLWQLCKHPSFVGLDISTSRETIVLSFDLEARAEVRAESQCGNQPDENFPYPQKGG